MTDDGGLSDDGGVTGDGGVSDDGEVSPCPSDGTPSAGVVEAPSFSVDGEGGTLGPSAL